jgi:MFS family permease
LNEWNLEANNDSSNQITANDWKLGAANASPFLFAALLGCPLSLPINYWFGRRGGIGFAAFLILCSSIGAIFVRSWTQMFGVRIINGIGKLSRHPQTLDVATKAGMAQRHGYQGGQHPYIGW